MFPQVGLRRVFYRRGSVLSAFARQQGVRFSNVRSVGRILPRYSLSRLFTRVNVHDHRGPRVRVTRLVKAGTLDLPLLGRHRRFLLRQRIRVSGLVRGRDATVHHLGSSFLHVPNVHGHPLLMSRGFTLRGVLESAPRISVCGQLPYSIEGLVRNVHRRVLSHAVLSDGRCVNVHDHRARRLHFRFLRNETFTGRSHGRVFEECGELKVEALVRVRFLLQFLFLQVQEVRVPFPTRFRNALRHVRRFVPVP